jgi:hypothetical protein
VYYGNQSGNYPSVIDAGANNISTISELSATQAYYFAVTAYTADAESALSKELACYFVTAATTTNGQIIPGGSTPVEAGGSQTFSIAPVNGYSVSNVLIDGVSVGTVSSYTFTGISASHTISATFAPNTYTITPGAGANGTISPSSAVTVNYGANQTFTVTPAAGYNVLDVQVDGSSVGAVTSYTFPNVTVNHTISATFAPNTYTITPGAGANGTISPSSAVTVNYGANQTFTITPATGYTVSAVQVDGSSVGAVTSYTFSNVTANHAISATFAANTYTITPGAGANGAISPSSAVTVNYGANQTFTITPATGYTVSAVQVDGSSVGAVTSYTFSNVTANHTISATFTANTYTITPGAGANGTISPSSAVTVNYGANQTFTITPATGYTISAVQVDGSSVGAVTSFTFSNVTANHTISATFTANTYTITPGAGANGTISPSSAVTVNYGANQTFTITPATGYKVSAVQVDGSSVGAVTSFTFSNVTANHTISATFAANTYTITPGAGANGAISPSSAVTVNYGANQTFTITPATGYTVSAVQVDGSSVGAVTSYTFSNVTANHSISATFAANTYTITPGAGANGAISPSSAVTVNYGANQTFTITPATGYKVSAVQVDGSSVGAVTSYMFSNVTANHTISTAFAPSTYTITSIAWSHGAISPSGSVSVPSGASKTFTITPAAHYQISNVCVDGRWIGATSSYTFTQVTANHSIAAIFAQTGVRIQATAQGNGSILPAGTVNVAAGANPSFTITPASGHQLTNVLVDGKSVRAVSAGKSAADVAPTGSALTYTFASLSKDHTIKAVFSKIPPPVTDAGPDQTVKTGSTVTLNGSNSTDPAVGIASYKWTQVLGSRVALSNPSARICTFKTPGAAGGKLLGFKLAVTNKRGVVNSDTCFVNVSADDGPPLADAGPSQTVSPYTIVTLNGLGSYDRDGAITSYRWVQIGGQKVGMPGVDSSHASFVAPNPGAHGASLVFQLQVTDRFGLTSRDWCTVNVVNSGTSPVADAGTNRIALEASTVSLDASGSLDPAGSSLTYRWKQIRGVPVTLSSPLVAAPVFTAPHIPDVQSADLLFLLTVTNANGLSASDKCTVTIKQRH